MTRFRVRYHLPALAIVLAAAGSLSAQSPSYSGVYRGQTSDGLGGFALFVDANQHVVLIGGYNYNDEGGDALYGSCTIDANGTGSSDISGITNSFSISTNGSVHVFGAADDGSYSYQMEGSLLPSGPFLFVSGFYTTNYSGGTDLEVIVTPDGWIYFSSPNHGGGGRAQVTSYGQAVTESSLGHSVSMFTLNQNAIVYISGANGNYSLNRVDSLPTTPVLGVRQLNLTKSEFVFEASGLRVGRTNILQASVDLKSTWIDAATNVAKTSTISFTNAVGAESQFYRLMQLQ